jgi:hypothetical protein
MSATAPLAFEGEVYTGTNRLATHALATFYPS